MAVDHKILNATIVFQPVAGKTPAHLICLCTCGWIGRLTDTTGSVDQFGTGLSLLSRMQGAWDAHLTPVVEVRP